MADLSVVLADAREAADLLRKHGHPEQAESLTKLADEVSAAARDYLWWLSESEALLRSGRSLRWLRANYRQWEATGNARRDTRGERQYRALVVPQRAHASAAREAGREAARLALQQQEGAA